jgi:ribosomal 30S subunit maturation factor RimM
MEVKTEAGEALIPFARPLCEVDLAQRTIRMELPEGILDL